MRAICVLLLLGFAHVTVGATAPTLDVYFIDVGHGDAILIDSGDWEALIDVGPDCQTASARVTKAVREHVEDRVIEAFILTHAHADHFGGFENVMSALQGYSVAEYWSAADTGPAGARPEYAAFVAGLGEMFPQAVQVPLKVSGTIRIGNIVWSVLAPAAPNADASENPAINANSLVLLLQYGPAVFLFAGDLETPPRVGGPWAIPSGILVIKAPHHGYEAEALDWITASFAESQPMRRPALIVFSTDDRVPAAATDLPARGVPFLTTRASGMICIHVDEMGAWATIAALAGRHICLTEP
jgi:beta-lactamase superfamily II metal-dependent hydrolase